MFNKAGTVRFDQAFAIDAVDEGRTLQEGVQVRQLQFSCS